MDAMLWFRAQMFVMDVASALVAFAANWLFQSTLLIASGLVVARLLRSRGSALKSAVYRTTLAAAIACPLATSLLSLAGVSGWSVEMPVAWTFERVDPPLEKNATSSNPAPWAAPRAPEEPEVPSHLSVPPSSPARVAQSGSDLGAPPREAFPHASTAALPNAVEVRKQLAKDPSQLSRSGAPPVRVPHWAFNVRLFGLAAVGMALVWLSISALLLLRLWHAWRRPSHLRSGAAPAPSAALQACRDAAALLGVAAPEVFCSPYLISPCLAGVWRPAVLLPEAASTLPLRDVLIHELAHLLRRDAFWNLVQRLAEAAFFYQPLLWMLTQRMESAAEEVCDDYVVQHGGDREGYARGLVEIAELSSIPFGVAGVAMVSLRSILAKRVLRILDSSRSLSTRVGNLLLALVIAGGLAGAGVAGFVGLSPQSSSADPQSTPNATSAGVKAVAARETPADENNPKSTVDKDAESATRQKTSGANEKASDQAVNKEPASDNNVRGRVIGADGKPVAGASVYWLRSRVHDIDPQPPRLLAATDKDGRFSFAEPPPVPADAPASWEYMDRILIRAPGHGFKFTSPGELRPQTNEPQGLVPALARALLGGQQGLASLPAAGEPLRGRLVDINGQPVAGARVRIRWFADENDQLGGLEEAKARGVKNPVWQGRVGYLLNVIEPVQLRDALPSAVTDAEGRFELRDLGPSRLVQLLVEGDGIETTEIVARNEPGEKIVLEIGWIRPGKSLTVYPHEFLHAVGPSKPVQGRVLDLDSGEPIAGAVVRAFQVQGEQVSSSREREHFAVRTDAAGRYRVSGLPVGKENELVAFATGDVAYIPVGRNADTSAAGAELELDFRLKRGVWAEGRVYDAETRKPFMGEISYYFFRDRQQEEAIPGLRQAFVDGLYWTNADGEFRVPVLPTRGILAFRYDGRDRAGDGIDRFARGFGADRIDGSEDLGGAKAFPTAPYYLMPTNYERIAEVPATNGQATVRVDMPLFASPPVTVRVVDAEGQPATRFQVYGANERWGWRTLDGPQFEIQDLQPGERRKVFVFQRETKLGGGIYVNHGAKETAEIKLVKAGSVRGRLLDAAGEPIDDATLKVKYEKLHSDDDSAIWASHPDLRSMPENIPVDHQGRFRLDGLIPGWSYHAYVSAPRMLNGQTVSMIVGSPFDDLRIEAGEEKDLGEVTIDAEKPKREKSDATKPDPAKESNASSPASTAESSAQVKTLRGRVTHDGRPAGGAFVAAIARNLSAKRGGDLSSSGEILAEGKTDENGEYSLRLVGASAKTHAYANVIARQQGAAIAWQQLNLDAADSKIDLELPAEEPIRGRLIDLEGQPAADVRLAISGVAERKEGDGLRSVGRGVGYDGDDVLTAWFQAVVSDGQGRFVIHGVPAGHGVFLEVEQNDRFAPLDISLNTGAKEHRGERDGTYRPLFKNVKPGEEAVLTLSPAQPFAGTVRYADSGEPAPFARISIWASQQEFAGSMISIGGGAADEKGHYQISPKPGVRFGLIAYPPAGVPYLARQTPLDEPLRWNASERVKQADVSLPRGVLVRGKVVEAGSNTPVAGAAVQYIPEEANNRNASDDILTGWQAIELSDEQGRFSIAVLPGPGRLLAHGPQGKYILQEISERELRRGKRGGERNYAHAILKLDPQRGASVNGRIVDELGQSVDEAIVVSRLDVSPYSLEWQGPATPTLGGRFELTGLAKEVEYPVSFLDVKRRLGATEIIKAGDAERTVVLKPCGGATLRTVDKNGKPSAGAYISVEIVVTPGAYRYDPVAATLGMLAADSDYIVNIDRTNQTAQPTSDEQGYIRLQALIPGASYRIIVTRGGTLRAVKQFQAKSNETLDLGDIVAERDQ